MKKILILGILILVLGGCKKEVVKVAPTVASVTSSAVITATTATISGSITADGGDAIIARGVVWGLNPNPTISDSKTSDGTGTGNFTSSITGLTPGKTYYFRTYATNSVGTSYGDQITLTTTANLPTITTTAATVITTGSITAGGNITSDGGASVTAKGICWSTASGPTISGNKTSDGTGTGTFKSTATSLAVSTTYYLRAYATNSAGTAYGNEIVVITLSQDIKNIVPDNIITTMMNLGMPIYSGKTPPNLVNFYKLSPRSMKNSNVPNDYSPGTNFYDMNIHFYNQDNNLLTLKMDFAEMGSGGGTGSGKGAFISGSGNNFSVFMQVTYTASGQTAEMVEIFSGTMTATGIQNLYDGLFMVDDHGDPGNLWIANGQGRIFYDSDGMSPFIASLSSMIFGNNLGIMSASPFIRVK